MKNWVGFLTRGISLFCWSLKCQEMTSISTTCCYVGWNCLDSRVRTTYQLALKICCLQINNENDSLSWKWSPEIIPLHICHLTNVSSVSSAVKITTNNSTGKRDILFLKVITKRGQVLRQFMFVSSIFIPEWETRLKNIAVV